MLLDFNCLNSTVYVFSKAATSAENERAAFKKLHSLYGNKDNVMITWKKEHNDCSTMEGIIQGIKDVVWGIVVVKPQYGKRAILCIRK